jgi:hypothetical protein
LGAGAAAQHTTLRACHAQLARQTRAREANAIASFFAAADESGPLPQPPPLHPPTADALVAVQRYARAPLRRDMAIDELDELGDALLEALGGAGEPGSVRALLARLRAACADDAAAEPATPGRGASTPGGGRWTWPSPFASPRTRSGQPIRPRKGRTSVEAETGASTGALADVKAAERCGARAITPPHCHTHTRRLSGCAARRRARDAH